MIEGLEMIVWLLILAIIGPALFITALIALIGALTVLMHGVFDRKRQ